MRTRPPLETAAKDALRKIAALGLQLRAGEGPEKRPLALAKGVQKLRRAAYHAHKARAPASRPLEARLLRVSASIERNGLDAQLADDLRAMIGPAVAVEAETGEPVAQRIASALDWFTKLRGTKDQTRNHSLFLSVMWSSNTSHCWI